MTNINEQYPDRAGLITASKCKDFMTKGRGEPFGETAKTYAAELVLAEMGYNPESFTTWQMEHGIENEPNAREIYEKSRGVICDLPGFIKMDGLNVGCTPDGMVGEDGLLEIKCPQPPAHTKYLLNGPPKEYIQQMQFQMMVTGAIWCDFMTFHPDFPEGLQAKVFRIDRDQDYIDLIKSRIIPFNELMAEIRAGLG